MHCDDYDLPQINKIQNSIGMMYRRGGAEITIPFAAADHGSHYSAVFHGPSVSVGQTQIGVCISLFLGFVTSDS